VQTALDAFGASTSSSTTPASCGTSVPQHDPELLDPVIDVHLKGAFYVTQPAFVHHAGAGLRPHRQHLVGNAGIFGNFGQTNYGAAKMGLVGFTRVLAVEGAKYNIKANAIAPVAKHPHDRGHPRPAGRQARPRDWSPRSWPGWPTRTARSPARSTLAAAPARRRATPASTGPVEYGGRGLTRAPVGLDRGVRRRRRAAVPQHGRPRAGRRGLQLFGTDDQQRASTCPRHHRRAACGASCSPSPGPAPTWRRCAPGPSRRRRVRRQRPEGLVLRWPGSATGASCWPAPTRRAQAQGHLVLPRRHAQPGRRDPPAAPDDRRGRVRRGLPHRRPPPRRRPARPAEQGWQRRHGHPHQRAGHIGAWAGYLTKRLEAMAALAAGRASTPARQTPPAALLSRGKAYLYMTQRQGPTASVGSSLGKLGMTGLMFDVAELRADLAGADAMLAGPGVRRPAGRPGRLVRRRHQPGAAQHHRRAHPRAAPRARPPRTPRRRRGWRRARRRGRRRGGARRRRPWHRAA
jgi:hypothetical protein